LPATFTRDCELGLAEVSRAELIADAVNSYDENYAYKEKKEKEEIPNARVTRSGLNSCFE